MVFALQGKGSSRLLLPEGCSSQCILPNSRDAVATLLPGISIFHWPRHKRVFPNVQPECPLLGTNPTAAGLIQKLVCKDGPQGLEKAIPRSWSSLCSTFSSSSEHNRDLIPKHSWNSCDEELGNTFLLLLSLVGITQSRQRKRFGSSRRIQVHTEATWRQPE